MVEFRQPPSIWLSKYIFIAKLLLITKFISKENIEYILFCRGSSIKWANASKKIPLPNNSIEVLYSSHILEHLDSDQTVKFLKESFRVLNHDGTIRLCVPDLKVLINKYLRSNDANDFIKEMLTCVTQPKTISGRLRYLLMGGRYHMWMYDGQTLSELLRNHGFVNPRILQAGETTIPNPGSLNLKERNNESVYVEAKKP